MDMHLLQKSLHGFVIMRHMFLYVWNYSFMLGGNELRINYSILHQHTCSMTSRSDGKSQPLCGSLIRRLRYLRTAVGEVYDAVRQWRRLRQRGRSELPGLVKSLFLMVWRWMGCAFFIDIGKMSHNMMIGGI